MSRLPIWRDSGRFALHMWNYFHSAVNYILKRDLAKSDSPAQGVVADGCADLGRDDTERYQCHCSYGFPAPPASSSSGRWNVKRVEKGTSTLLLHFPLSPKIMERKWAVFSVLPAIRVVCYDGREGIFKVRKLCGFYSLRSCTSIPVLNGDREVISF